MAARIVTEAAAKRRDRAEYLMVAEQVLEDVHARLAALGCFADIAYDPFPPGCPSWPAFSREQRLMMLASRVQRGVERLAPPQGSAPADGAS